MSSDLRFTTAIFDMDGLLLESESLWQQAEAEAVQRLGLPLTRADFEATMGVRMRDVARFWYENWGWDAPITSDEVADQVISRVAELVADRVPLPGVIQALDLVEQAGMTVALCSSSDGRLIEASLAALGLAERFTVTHSAQHDDHGKPHPQPYLSTTGKLGVSPSECIVFEDSVAGAISAKSAGATVVAVPHPGTAGSGQFGFADAVLGSLCELDMRLLQQLSAKVPVPNTSRPRFHLAFPVDDLANARRFYGEIMGCREGRSAENWVDFDFYGHQIVAHLDPSHRPPATNQVDGKSVPAAHFGLLLTVGAWSDLAERFKTAEVPFIIDPYVRFEGEPGEQRTFFVKDPAGNALEFKAFTDDRITFSTTM